MPEIQLFMTEQDEIELVRFVLAQGAALIPDLDYSRPKPQILGNDSQFTSARSSTRHFFIIRDDYFKMPLEMRRIEKEGKVVYYVAQRKGGPTIDFLGSGLITRDFTRFIKPGMLSHYPTFFDTQEECFQKVPKELVRFYRSITNFLRESCVRVKPKKVRFWATRNSERELRRGAKLIGLEDLSSQEILDPTKKKGTA